MLLLVVLRSGQCLFERTVHNKVMYCNNYCQNQQVPQGSRQGFAGASLVSRQPPLQYHPPLPSLIRASDSHLKALAAEAH